MLFLPNFQIFKIINFKKRFHFSLPFPIFQSDNAAELDKAINNSTHNNNNNSSSNKNAITDSTTREYISSPGYETSSSTAPASSPDPCEYTYEGAIQDYKQRVSRAASGLTSVALNKLSSQQQQINSKESTPERPLNKETAYPPRRGSKIEDRLMGFEVQSPSEECVEKNTKVDVPKIDISKRKEIFESANESEQQPKSQVSTGGVPRVTLRDRFKVQETTEPLTEQPKKELKRLSGDITSIKERLQSLEKQQSLVNDGNGASKTTANKLVDIPVPPLKERLSSLQNAVTKEEVRKPPVVLVDARQLEIMKSEEEKAQMNLKETKKEKELETVNEIKEKVTETNKTEDIKSEVEEIDRDDSGIHTADDIEVEEKVQADIMKKEQELKLNAAIEALAKEEKQLSEAANAVNQIEAEFEELSIGSVALPPLANNQNGAAAQANITNDHMEYSVSSTNPTNEISSSNNDNNSNLNNSSSITSSNNSSGSGPNSSVSSETVKGLDFKSATNLRRKPTNEMVHAKNLLKIFKETFQNDIELDEQEVNEEPEVKEIKETEDSTKKSEDLSLNIKTQIFENSKNTSTLNKEEENLKEEKVKEDTKASVKEESTSKPNTPNSPSTPLTPSMIPRSMTPLGKPPMSPQSLRAHTKFMSATPPGSPSLARKHDSQFSINGRVEIFNSKTMTSTPNVVKPLTPTMTTKKTQMPYINAPKTSQSNNIVLPQQQQQQLQQDVTTKSFTVIEPLSTSTTVAVSDATAVTATTTNAGNNHLTNENNEHLKSMPSSSSAATQQMVNEPQTKLDTRETYHQQQPQHQTESTNHNNELVKQQQPEVVICAPPITIVNPDELPKPNTVKNLSSCFQQQDNSNSHAKVPLPAPKPLPRSRIPQATPPPSPVLPRRHICYTSESSSKDTESNKLSPTSCRADIEGEVKKTVLEDDKKLSLISNSSSSSTSSKLSPTPSPLEEEKKLSVISSSSTSSTSTASTVIEAKKLSVISNNSSNSEDNKPSFGQTQAQIHKEPEKSLEVTKDSEKTPEETPAKVLNKEATEALVEEMIKANKQARTLILDTKNMPAKPKDLRPLSPLKIDVDKAQENDNKSQTTPLSPLPQKQEPKTPSSVSPVNKPFTSPLAPLHSPKSELFKTTTPLVVSTLYDKYQPTPLPPNNQRTPLAPLKPTTPQDSTPTIIIPAELPNLPDCPPNESSLYKIASAPHSPTSPKSPSSDKNLALDAAICNSLLTSLAVTPNVLQRQYTVEEDLCQKVDKDTLPFHQGTTGFKEISKADIKKCDGLTPSAQKLQGSTQRQKTVEEELCQKLDINTLPDGKQQPITGYKSVSPTDIRKCDNFFTTGSAKPSSKPNSKPSSPIMQTPEAHSKAVIETCEKTSSAKTSCKPSSKPSSPIMQAREAHSRALIETCEKIIAEERLASSQMKSSLPSSPVGTPLMQRKSKIPKPIPSCCKATESLNEADLKANTPATPSADNNGVIARMHVVETQIKVTTTTPPASPKVSPKPQPSPQTPKKTKNIFDFLKKNFGVGGHSHKDDHQTTPESEEKPKTPTSTSESLPPATPEQKVLVLTEQELRELEKVQYDEIHNIDNSKFYVPTKEMEEEEEEAIPPPLPKTPAPVNIEITRKVITNEILEDGKTEQDITKEIDELLDDELNKLNQEIEELEKAGRKH